MENEAKHGRKHEGAQSDLKLIFRHGEKWDQFRAQVQHVMLQPSTAKKYVAPLNDITTDFMER